MLTRSAVIRLMGPTRLDDHSIVEIIGTGASPADLIEALNRLSPGSEVAAEKMKPMSRRVALLCDILTNANPDWEDR